MVTNQIEKHLTANMNIKKRNIIVGNFLGGLAWGLGTVIGATIIAAVVLGILRFFNFIPGLNDILQSIPKSPR